MIRSVCLSPDLAFLDINVYAKISSTRPLHVSVSSNLARVIQRMASLQMPATRPPSGGLPESQLEIVHSENEPFKITYDKLVIAVGAYSQSIFPEHSSSVFLMGHCFSLQRSWC